MLQQRTESQTTLPCKRAQARLGAINREIAGSCRDRQNNARSAPGLRLRRHRKTVQGRRERSFLMNAEFSRKELYDLVWSQPMRTLAMGVGISDVALAKHCKKLNVPVPSRGYWARR